MTRLPEAGLDLLFRDARTHNAWQAKPVPQELLNELFDLARLGPTSVNSSPLRVVFAVSPEAKAKVLAAVNPGNVEKTRGAPVTAILGHDLRFYDQLPKLFPHNPGARDWFANDVAKAEDTAFRNGTLQCGYFIMAARALGLDCGPLSGFDAAKIKAEFFPEEHIRVNFLCNLGYGDASGLFGRGPRLDFAEACALR